MLKSTCKAFIILLTAVFAIGCSGSGQSPVTPRDNPVTPDLPEQISRESAPAVELPSQRILWGVWTVSFDPVEMKIVALPARELLAHYNITDMILPPACEDCFDIAVNSFDPVTRILDADVTLRNPAPIGAHDVRGIMHVTTFGHLLTNPDAWTKFYDVPGGMDINPFKAFAKDEPNRTFAGLAEHTENYLVYIPQPPVYAGITFAVDASWPGNCKEPYSIENFGQDDPLYPVDGSSCDIHVDVIDWQDDVDAVQIEVPEITGTDYVDLANTTGNTWTLQLTNNEVAPVGDYEAVISATSANSGETKLYDVVTITITDTDGPIVTGIDPDMAELGDDIVDAAITGSNFLGPCEVELWAYEYAITATSVEVIDANNITCDFSIPLEAWLGTYDVLVRNFDDKEGVGESLFDVLPPTPVVDGIVPDHQFVNHGVEGAEITGDNFTAPCYVELNHEGFAITTTGVEVISATTINCDFNVPMDADIGLYDVRVMNSYELFGTGAEMFSVECPMPVIDYTIPESGQTGSTLVGVEVHGDYFIYPGMELRLKMDGEADIIGYNISSVDHTLFYCDFDIPEGAVPGDWDMEIRNGCGEVNLWEESFEILSPEGWAQTWGGPDEDEALDMAFDDDGNSYVTGYFRNTVDFDPGPGVVERTSVGSEDAFVCKFKPQGELEWALTWGSTSGDRGYGVAVDDSGVVLVTGHFQGTTDFDTGDGTEEHTPVGATDAYLSAFSSEGEFYGVSTWGGASSDAGLAVVADGPDAYVTGLFTGFVDFDWDDVDVESRTSVGATDIFILKAVGEGDFGWVQTWGDTSNDEGESVAVDSSGNVYVCGTAKGYSVDFDPDPEDVDLKDGGPNCWGFLSKFDSTGDYLWSGRWGNNSDTYAPGVAVDGDDNIYVAGSFMWYNIDLDPNTVGEDIHVNSSKSACYLSKFDSSGDYIWGLHWGGTDEDGALGVAANSSGDIFVSGYFTGDADLDPDEVDVDTHTGFGMNAFFSRFDASGDYIWGKSWGSENTAQGVGVAAGDTGDSWVTGWFQGTAIDFDPDPEAEDFHTSNGSHDVFLSKFLPDGTW